MDSGASRKSIPSDLAAQRSRLSTVSTLQCSIRKAVIDDSRDGHLKVYLIEGIPVQTNLRVARQIRLLAATI